MTTIRWMPGPARPAPARTHEVGHHVAWYVLAGAITTGLQSALFLLAQPAFGSFAANLASIAVTTVANTEFHRRVTFADTPSRPARRHLQSVLTFLFYAGYGSVVLASLHVLDPGYSATEEATVLAAASVLGGVARFVLLRWWVFARTAR
ncbi:GtrA family protein [Amycolatopsis nigrescens]|uniref:GtrA family protein n=1 Tax=Amycolatopsis nigrescens TaxID=381445 RepID=UPI00037FE6B4|nr:GtrA family protein [Amycolatopsis nigrescens]